MEPKKMLAYPRRNLLCSHLHFAVSLGYPRMEPTEEMDYPGWNLLKSRTTSDGVHSWVIYMLLLPSCYPRMKPRAEMNCPGWNPLCSHLLAAVSIGLPPDGVHRGDGPLWMESRLKPRTAALDRRGICRTYCHSSFSNNMKPVYNNMRPFYKYTAIL